MKLHQQEVIWFFDQAAAQRPFLPNPHTLSGWGKYQKYQMAVELLQQTEGEWALDLGCNIGHIPYLYHHQLAANPNGQNWLIAGIDPSLSSLQRALSQQNPLAFFAAASGITLPFADNSFQVVLCVEVLEHILDQTRCLHEIYRVLQPGGTLFLTSPNPHCLPSLASYRLQRLFKRLVGRPEADKDQFLSRSQLRNYLTQAGFINFDLSNSYWLPRPFMTWRGWVLFPPMPAQWGLGYQKWWIKQLGKRGEKLPLWWRDKLCHSFVLSIQKDTV